MSRTGIAALGVLTALVFAVVLLYLVQEQRQQAQQLTRLSQCVATLERNQGAPQGGPIMNCRIYN